MDLPRTTPQSRLTPGGLTRGCTSYILLAPPRRRNFPFRDVVDGRLQRTVRRGDLRSVGTDGRSHERCARRRRAVLGPRVAGTDGIAPARDHRYRPSETQAGRGGRRLEIWLRQRRRGVRGDDLGWAHWACPIVGGAGSRGSPGRCPDTPGTTARRSTPPHPHRPGQRVAEQASGTRCAFMSGRRKMAGMRLRSRLDLGLEEVLACSGTTPDPVSAPMSWRSASPLRCAKDHQRLCQRSAGRNYPHRSGGVRQPHRHLSRSPLAVVPGGRRAASARATVRQCDAALCQDIGRHKSLAQLTAPPVASRPSSSVPALGHGKPRAGCEQRWSPGGTSGAGRGRSINHGRDGDGPWVGPRSGPRPSGRLPDGDTRPG